MNSTVGAPMSRPDPMLLPTPQARERIFPVISVDDHLHEPADVFEGRLPAQLQDRAPRRVDTHDGGEGWAYEGKVLFESGLEAVAGRDPSSWDRATVRDSEMRPGAFEINERVKDMDIDGVYAQVVFPGGSFGFSGRQIMMSDDRELGLATMRAYNDWHLEVLAGTHPGRIIPMQLVWYVEPEIAAQEIRKNAERGFTAATLPDLPPHLGLPRVADSYWDPIWRALEETETVVCVHLGSASWVLDPLPKEEAAKRAPGSALDISLSALFPASSMVTGIEWVLSGVLNRFPKLKLALSEGGIGWVPMAIDRLDYITHHSASAQMRREWIWDETPAETLVNHIWYCVLDNPSNMAAIDMIGSDHVMMETDYPHSDSTWPDSQELFASRLGMLPTDDALNIAYRNAERIFRHPVPQWWLDTTKVHPGTTLSV